MPNRKLTPRARLAAGLLGAGLVACLLPAATRAAAPTVTITPDRAPDAAPWYNHPVTFTATSSDSSATCDPPVTYSGPDNATASVTMHCTGGGSTGSATVTFAYDSTPPVTTATLDPAEPNGLHGWYLGPVTLTLSAIDRGGSGVSTMKMNGGGGPIPFARAAVQCLGTGSHVTTYKQPVRLCSDGAHAVDYWAVDRAGNVEPFQTIRAKIDAHAPKVTLGTPKDGAVIKQDKVVKAAFKCSDATSGIDTCAGTVANGSPIDTSTVGDHTFTVKGTDVAGNTTTVTHHYQVVYAWNGFFSPVTNTETSKLNLVHAGDLVKLGFSLDGDRGTDVFAAGFPTSVPISCPSWPPHSVPAAGAGATPGLSFGTASGHYSFGWATSATWAGSCRRFELKLNDGTSTLHTADFMFFA